MFLSNFQGLPFLSFEWKTTKKKTKMKKQIPVRCENK